MPSFFYAASILASRYALASAATSPASDPALSPSCGLKGYDKSPAYNFLNDPVSANFDQCSARCTADSACVSFAYGLTECLLYTQTVASNVNEVSNSPFTFYDKSCAAPSSITSEVPSSTPSIVSSSQTSSDVSTSSSYESQSTASATMLSSGYESWPTSSYLTPSGSETESSSGHEAYPTGSESSTSAESQPYPTDSEETSPAAETAHTTATPTYSSEVTDEGPETVTSYIDVIITSCPPGAQACATTSSEGSPAASSLSVDLISSPSPSSMVAGSAGSSSSPGTPQYPETSAAPTQNTEALESYTTVITTHYIGICPTGYTTIPYTTTVVTASGASSTPAITSQAPAGFTTTVAVCPACDSASPTVTLTIPVVSVVPVPVPTKAPSEFTPPAGSSPAGSSPAGSSPAGSSPAGSSPAGSSPAGSSPAGSAAEIHATVSPSSESSPAGDSTLAGYGSSAPAPQTSSTGPAGYTPAYPTPPKSSAPPATGVSQYSTVSNFGYPDAVPTTTNPPYDAGNITLSFQTAPASAGSQTTGASKGLSGAEATRPAPYTGGASEVGKGTFVAAVIAVTWVGLLVV